MKRVIVCGSGAYTDRDAVRGMLGKLNETWGACVLVHGPNSGADHMAVEFAQGHGWECELVSADWRDGKESGRKRAERIAASGADVCLAFPTKGMQLVWDSLRIYFEAGIPVRIATAVKS